MVRLPRISAREAVAAFQRMGYVVVRQRGSHLRLRHPEGTLPPLTVPDHGELKSGLLRRLVRDAGLTVDEFVGLLGG